MVDFEANYLRSLLRDPFGPFKAQFLCGILPSFISHFDYVCFNLLVLIPCSFCCFYFSIHTILYMGSILWLVVLYNLNMNVLNVLIFLLIGID